MAQPETPPRVRGEYAKSAQRRRQIIVAAVEVFSESGFRDGSLRAVAERAGISHAGMRHHFPTKVDLLETVLKWREDESLAKARVSHPVGIDVIRAWIDSVSENTARPALVELEAVLGAEAISPDHPAHDYFTDLYHRGVRLLSKAFETMADTGELRSEFAPSTAGRLLLANTLGLQSLWLRERSFDLASELRAHTETMLTVPL